MSSSISRAPLRSIWNQCTRRRPLTAAFSTSTRLAADEPPNPTTSVMDAISPAKTSRPSPSTAIPSRRPSEPSDSSNPSLFAFPTGMGSRPNQRTAPGRNPSPTDISSNSPSQADALYNTLSRTFASRPPSHKAPADMAFQRRARALEGQASRNWASGDTYAPHDLSSTEMLKARAARFAPRASNLPPANTRKRGGKDVLDDLGIDPRKEYKNFGFIGEFVTEMGRIRHGRETGLRGVNQRRVAKAVRRAVGVGIMPSVHRHPEMHETRMLMRGNARTR